MDFNELFIFNPQMVLYIVAIGVVFILILRYPEQKTALLVAFAAFVAQLISVIWQAQTMITLQLPKTNQWLSARAVLEGAYLNWFDRFLLELLNHLYLPIILLSLWLFAHSKVKPVS